MRDRGFALPLVLIVLALLTTLAMGLSRMARIQTSQMQFEQQMWQINLKMMDARESLVLAFLTGRKGRNIIQYKKMKIPVDGRPFFLNGVKIEVQDTAGLIGLEPYDELTFQRLLSQLASPEEARILAAALGDWVDEDGRTRLYGMESQAYASQTGGGVLRNRPLRTLSELMEVYGFTKELFYGRDGSQGLRDLVVLGAVDDFNADVAPEVVLRAKLGFNASKVRQLIVLRESQSWRRFDDYVRLSAFAGDESMHLVGGRFIIRMEMEGVRARGYLLLMPDMNDRPYMLYLWQFPDASTGS